MAAWVCSKDLCGADDGDIVRQKKPILGRLTSGNLHRLTLGREACESPTLPARLLPTMSRGHLPTDRDLVTRLGLFLRGSHWRSTLGWSPRGSRGRRISAVQIFENPSRI